MTHLGPLLALMFAIAVGYAQTTCAFEIYRAIPPYSPSVGEVPHAVDLDGKARTFDFGGAAPFHNAATGAADFATINVWNPILGRAQVLSGTQIPGNGVADRVFKTKGYTAIGYVRGDGIVEGKLRTQINSFPIPARKHFVWELSFRLGGRALTMPWVFTSRGVAPATLWQLKTFGLPPTLVMAVDTDPIDATKVSLNFDARLDPFRPATRLGELGGLNPSTDTEVRIEAFLDERPALQGTGFLKIWVNDNQVVDRWGPLLQEKATFPYHWSLAMYLYNNAEPLDMDRFVFWKNARLLVKN